MIQKRPKNLNSIKIKLPERLISTQDLIHRREIPNSALGKISNTRASILGKPNTITNRPWISVLPTDRPLKWVSSIEDKQKLIFQLRKDRKLISKWSRSTHRKLRWNCKIFPNMALLKENRFFSKVTPYLMKTKFMITRTETSPKISST